MKKLSTALFSVCMVSSMGAFASLADVCDMSNRSSSEQLIAKGYSESDAKGYLGKLARECELSNTYRDTEQRLQQKFGIGLKDITEYQALRFTQRSWFEQSAAANKPVEKTYQPFATDYSKPIELQAAAAWDDWAVGIRQLEPEILELASGKPFDLNVLKRIHRGLFPFYPMISEAGDFAHHPNPGVLKPTGRIDSAGVWWTIKGDSEISKARAVVNQANANYDAMGLLVNPPPGIPADVKGILALRPTPTVDPTGISTIDLYSAHPIVTRQDLDLVLAMVDAMLKQAQSGQAMAWKGRLFTPGELAYFIQQLYVRIHPFYEGNGRTSRFLQELILMSFNLPHGASGDLMDDDILTEDSAYYKMAIDRNFSLFGKVNECIKIYEGQRRSNVRDMDQDLLPYNCRILQDRSAVWQSLKQQNEQSANYYSGLQELKELNLRNEQEHLQIMRERNPQAKPTKPGQNRAGEVPIVKAPVVQDNVPVDPNETPAQKERRERMERAYRQAMGQ